MDGRWAGEERRGWREENKIHEEKKNKQERRDLLSRCWLEKTHVVSDTKDMPSQLCHQLGHNGGGDTLNNYLRAKLLVESSKFDITLHWWDLMPRFINPNDAITIFNRFLNNNCLCLLLFTVKYFGDNS